MKVGREWTTGGKLKKQVFVPTKDHFGGLFGVFADSLPDNWGRLLLDRLLRQHGENPDDLTPIDRLAIVGKSGMGALTYHPERWSMIIPVVPDNAKST